MFSKGNRFPNFKAPEAPAPNAYDPHDPEFDMYKRGAFLEKQDRFSMAKPSEVPGPGSYDPENKPVEKKPVHGTRVISGDKYAALQKKLEDLERLHSESKKAHQAEVERLKLELNRYQKLNTEQTERIDKLKKQNDLQDAKIQELRRTNLSDQSEIKDLRAKLRVSEHERGQMAAKQGHAGETKTAMKQLDARRKEEVREREKKIGELEKALASEKRKREVADGKLAEVKGSVDAETRAAEQTVQNLQDELSATRKEADKVRSTLAALQSNSKDTEEDLLEQLEQHKALISRVAQEYGRLASSTVAKAEHERVKYESRALQLKLNRLERKSGNKDGQITELTHMVRHAKDENALLSSQLKEIEQQLGVYAETLQSVVSLSDNGKIEEDVWTMTNNLATVGREFRRLDAEIIEYLQAEFKLWTKLDSYRRWQLLLHATYLVKHVDEAQKLADQRSKDVKSAENRAVNLAGELYSARAEHDSVKAQLLEATSNLAVSRATEEDLRKQVEATRNEKKAELVKLEKAVKQEKEATQRLAGVVQQHKAAEDALATDIEQLTADLAEAEQYKDAYFSMIDEVDALVRRNALAENEASKLSKFNAEILGHKNPAQRIMYVDRIRQELHETKHKLLMTTKDKEAVIEENEELRHELGLYKSVAVPLESKPRAFMTRVTRAPLASQNLNAPPPNARASHARSASAMKSLANSDMEYRDGDMTIDELA